jgi:hypothetical protein
VGQHNFGPVFVNHPKGHSTALPGASRAEACHLASSAIVQCPSCNLNFAFLEVRQVFAGPGTRVLTTYDVFQDRGKLVSLPSRRNGVYSFLFDGGRNNVATVVSFDLAQNFLLAARRRFEVVDCRLLLSRSALSRASSLE